MTVTIEPWGEGDLPLLERMNTPEMTAHLGGPESAEDLERRQARYLRVASTGGRMFRIEVDGEPAGGIGYWESDDDGTPAYEAGWSVVPEHQGAGVAGAALRLLIAEVRRDGRRALLTAYPGVDNAASNALCARAGFEVREPWGGGELHFRVWALDLSPLDLTGRVATVDERFDTDTLSPDRWWPFYTPHWSSRERTAARYEIADGFFLRIEEDTPPWAPEWDGDVRVSHLQTGGNMADRAHHRRVRRPRLRQHPQCPLTHIRRLLPVHRVPSLLEERNESQADSDRSFGAGGHQPLSRSG